MERRTLRSKGKVLLLLCSKNLATFRDSDRTSNHRRVALVSNGDKDVV